MKQISIDQYGKLVNQVSPKVSFKKTGSWAFLFGGLICAIGESLRLWFESMNFSDTDSGICVCVILIFATAILTGLGLFHKIAKFGGAGTFVPITGFANSIVSPALEFKTEGFVLGVCSNMFIIAGPVLVYGVVSSIISGIIFQIMLWFGVIG